VVVTDDTPICNALRSLGREAGLGLITTRPIRAGDAVVEYVGEVLTRDQAEARERWYAFEGYEASYPLFTEMHGFVIDATLYGNVARFMNASCEPNLRQKPMAHEQPGLPRVIFRAVRDIMAGEELTWRYGAATATPASTQQVNEYAKQAKSYGGRRRVGQGPGRDRASLLEEAFGFQNVACVCGSSKCRQWL
jgi:SET domain-containing protein